MQKKRIVNLSALGVIIGAIPILTGLVNFLLFSPIYVNGYWFSIDPTFATGINKAYNGECLILSQKRFSAAVTGSFFDSPDEIYFIGQATRAQLDLNYIAYRNYDPDSDYEESANGQVLLTKTSSTELRGIWRESVSSNGNLAGPGRWILKKSNKQSCNQSETLRNKYNQFEYTPNL